MSSANTAAHLAELLLDEAFELGRSGFVLEIDGHAMCPSCAQQFPTHNYRRQTGQATTSNPSFSCNRFVRFIVSHAFAARIDKSQVYQSFRDLRFQLLQTALFEDGDRFLVDALAIGVRGRQVAHRGTIREGDDPKRRARESCRK